MQRSTEKHTQHSDQSCVGLPDTEVQCRLCIFHRKNCGLLPHLPIHGLTSADACMPAVWDGPEPILHATYRLLLPPDHRDAAWELP